MTLIDTRHFMFLDVLDQRFRLNLPTGISTAISPNGRYFFQ